MKVTRIYVIIVLGIVFLQQGCFKDKIDEERLLTDEMKSQNPYHKQDKLYFESNNAKEYILDVSFRTNEIFEYQNGNYATNYLVELEKTSINSLDTSQQCGFWLEMVGYDRPPRLTLYFDPPSKVGMTAYFDLPLNKDRPEFVDSVYINEKWHYGVYVEENAKVDSNAYRLYYSTELGIIKIDFSDDSTWELKKIEWAE